MDLAEEARGAADERTASVIIVTKVVVIPDHIPKCAARNATCNFTGKPDITSVRVGDADRRIGIVWE